MLLETCRDIIKISVGILLFRSTDQFDIVAVARSSLSVLLQVSHAINSMVRYLLWFEYPQTLTTVPLVKYLTVEITICPCPVANSVIN